MTVDEWVPLGQLLRRPPRYGINAAAVPLSQGVPTYLRITDISPAGKFAPSPKVGVANVDSANYLIRDGELVFARTGASVGKSYLYNPNDGELVYAGFLINVAPDPSRLNPKYLSVVAQTKSYWDWVARTSVRSGQPGINGREYAQLPIPLRDISVQNQVADTIADVDGLIHSLEKLVAKKQSMKLGMIQRLLTAQVRLPGFTGTWTESKLRDAGRCLRGVAYDPTADLSSGDRSYTVRLLRSNNVQSGRIDSNDLQYVNQRRVSPAQFLRDEDVVICMANGSRSLVGKAALFENGDGLRYTFGAFMGAFRANPVVASPRYIAEVFGTYAFRNWLDVILSGSSINNLRPRDIEDFSSMMPPLPEQEAIARVLADASREIDHIRQRLVKAHSMRTGMIQQLFADSADRRTGEAAS